MCTHAHTFFSHPLKVWRPKHTLHAIIRKEFAVPRREDTYLLLSPFLKGGVMSLTDWFLNRWGRTFPFLSLFYSEVTCWGSWCLPANQPPAQDPGQVQRVSQGRTFWRFFALPALLAGISTGENTSLTSSMSSKTKTRFMDGFWNSFKSSNLQRKWFLLLFIYVMWFQAAKDTCRDVSTTCFFCTRLGMFILEKITQNSLWSPYLICIIHS